MRLLDMSGSQCVQLGDDAVWFMGKRARSATMLPKAKVKPIQYPRFWAGAAR
jgi:hypothetical protein